MITLTLATKEEKAWAQSKVTECHYLHKPVDRRGRVLVYVIRVCDRPMGCLMFSRPEATWCYSGGLTYGSLADVERGRAQYSRWEILNLSRVWLDPALQHGGNHYIPNAATHVIGKALRSVVLDYLLAYPPIYLEEPWRLRTIMSYCDTRVHRGTIYQAAGFTLARTNKQGVQTWIRPLRKLQPHEQHAVIQQSHISPRAERMRAERTQLAFTF